MNAIATAANVAWWASNLPAWAAFRASLNRPRQAQDELLRSMLRREESHREMLACPSPFSMATCGISIVICLKRRYDVNSTGVKAGSVHCTTPGCRLAAASNWNCLSCAF